MAETKKFVYDDFKYGPYKASGSVNQALIDLNTHLQTKPTEPTFTWDEKLNTTIQEILDRNKFTYDLNGDALYQQYKDKYIQQGKLAMGDAIGQASAMTGGYGNSYAQSVGQQAYQGELNNLNDIIPELYAMAYDKYNQEGQDLYNKYSMLGSERDWEHGKYREDLSDWYTDRDYLANRHDSEREYDYNKYNNDRTFAYGKYADDKSYAYNEYRNGIADEQWQKNYDAQYGNTAADEKERLYSGIDPKTGSNYNNGSLTTAQVKALQAALGVTADGYYGPDSTKAAGGLSAEEAYAKFVGNGGGNRYTAVATQGVTNFQAGIRTRNEFYGRSSPEKEKYKTYEAYIEGKLDQWLHDGRLTEDEVATLIAYYGL